MSTVAYDAREIASRVMAHPERQAMALSVEETIVLAVAVIHPGVTVTRDEHDLLFTIPARTPAEAPAPTQEEIDHDR